jgi:hypothetical protein
LVFSDVALPKVAHALTGGHGFKTPRHVHSIPDEERFVPDDIDAIGFVVDVTGVVDLIRFSCIAPSGPPGQLVTSSEIPSSFVASRGSGISPVPPMSVMREPGIRPVLPVPLAEEEIAIPPVPVRAGAIRAGLSAPMQGADGTVPAGAAADIDPIGLALASPPGCVAPRGLLTPSRDASLADETPVAAVEHAAGTLPMADVDMPDMGDNPGSPVSPPPSKVELLLDDPPGHGEAMDWVPMPTGEAAPISGALPIRLVCAKPGLTPSRNSPVASGSNNKVSGRPLRSSCHTLNTDPSPRDMALPPDEVLC